MPRKFTVAFWIGGLSREACKARGQASGLTLVQEDTHYLYFRVHADGIRQAENLVYNGAEPSNTPKEPR